MFIFSVFKSLCLDEKAGRFALVEIGLQK